MATIFSQNFSGTRCGEFHRDFGNGPAGPNQHLFGMILEKAAKGCVPFKSFESAHQNQRGALKGIGQMCRAGIHPDEYGAMFEMKCQLDYGQLATKI